jgi:hypothetical protein
LIETVPEPIGLPLSALDYARAAMNARGLSRRDLIRELQRAAAQLIEEI